MDDSIQEFDRMGTATLAGGCFWCLEPIFEELIGVEKVVVGYTGGHVNDPSYHLVCTGSTGHAEAIQVTFDPKTISYEELLQIFFTFHNPTTLNRQGADVGTQYRSAIFYHDEGQKKDAEEVIREIEVSKIWDDPVVTEVAPIETFYPAEEYHQGYYKKNPYQGYCQAVISPKVSKFRQNFSHKIKQSAR